MATSFILSTVPYTASPAHPTVSGKWDLTTGFDDMVIDGVTVGSGKTFLMLVSSGGDNSTGSEFSKLQCPANESASANKFVLAGIWVSEPLTSDFSITSAFAQLSYGQIADSGASVNQGFVLRVWNEGANTIRGTLVSNQRESGNLTEGSYTWGAGTLTSCSNVSAKTGDRLVLEVGYIFRNSTTTQKNCYLQMTGTNEMSGDVVSQTNYFQGALLISITGSLPLPARGLIHGHAPNATAAGQKGDVNFGVVMSGSAGANATAAAPAGLYQFSMSITGSAGAAVTAASQKADYAYAVAMTGSAGATVSATAQKAAYALAAAITGSAGANATAAAQKADYALAVLVAGSAGANATATGQKGVYLLAVAVSGSAGANATATGQKADYAYAVAITGSAGATAAAASQKADYALAVAVSGHSPNVAVVSAAGTYLLGVGMGGGLANVNVAATISEIFVGFRDLAVTPNVTIICIPAKVGRNLLPRIPWHWDEEAGPVVTCRPEMREVVHAGPPYDRTVISARASAQPVVTLRREAGRA